MLKATEDWGQTYKLDTDRCRHHPICRRGLGLAVYGSMAAVVTFVLGNGHLINKLFVETYLPNL